MKFKPKEVLVSLPQALTFANEDEIVQMAAAFNTFVHGKVKMKYEVLGVLGGQTIGLFYMQRNNESQQLRDEFMRLIEAEEMHELASPFDPVERDLEKEKAAYAKQQWDEDAEFYFNGGLEPEANKYDEEYGDDRLCLCGHTYYRHFDSYEDMAPVGCKYCFNGGDEHIFEDSCPFFKVEKPE